MRACRVYLLALVALLACASESLAQFPPAKVRFLSHSALASELRSAPFRPEFRDEVVASLKKSMPLYTFLNLNRDSTLDAPSNTHVFVIKEDTMADIDAFAQQTFDSEYDMNDALANIFLKLQDAHTAYGRPYAGYAFSLPLRLESRMANVDAGDMRHGIFLSEIEGMYDIYASVYGASPLANITLADGGAAPAEPLASVQGFELEAVDGTPALQYFWQLASNTSSFRVGVSKEQHTRFNLLTHGFSADPTAPPGWWAYRAQTRLGMPQAERVTLTLRDVNEPNTRYTLPLFFVGMAPQKNASLLAGEQPLPQPQLPRNPILAAQAEEQHWWSLHSLQHPAVYHQRQMLMGERAGAMRAELLSAAAPQLSPDPSGAASLPGKISFSVLDDNTGVLQINTFNPGDENLVAFLQVLQESITNHQQNMGGTRLLVDLRSNGGGDICLGYAVLRFLFPQLTEPAFSTFGPSQPFGRYDMQQSELTEYLASIGSQSQRDQPINNTCGFFTPCYWVNPSTEMPFSDDAWWDSGRMITRGGVEKEFTALFHDQCQDYFQKLSPPGINNGYAPDDVVLLSDGMCGSTCAVFSSFILENGLAKLLALGGLPDLDLNGGLKGMQPFSFSGGQVADFAELNEILDGYGVPRNHSLVPQPYSNGARQSWTFREIYHWKDTEFTYPHEFRRFRAHFHSLYPSSFTDVGALYALAQGYLGSGKCAKGVTDLSCDVRNGTGVHKCVDGVVQEDCIATGCNPGNMLASGPEELAECVPCPSGFYQPFFGEDDACAPCQVPAELVLPEDGAITCEQEFTAEGWINDDCPFTVTCTTPGDHAHKGKGGVSSGVFWAVTVILVLVAVGMLVALMNLRRKLHHAQAASFDNQVGFTRMEA